MKTTKFSLLCLWIKPKKWKKYEELDMSFDLFISTFNAFFIVTFDILFKFPFLESTN